MKILILEDEPLVAKDLKSAIRALEPEVLFLDTIQSVEEGIEWFKSNEEPDLIFADIQLSDGISFDIFEKIKPDSPIIFTTAYDEYAVKAFKLNSIDYLLKPIDKKELREALSKYKKMTSAVSGRQQLTALLESLKAPTKFKERFLAVFKNALVPIAADDVAYFHKEELIFLYTKQNERYLTEYKSLEELEHLIDPSCFYRVNRQFIIHVDSVLKIKSKIKGITVMLRPPTAIEIDISREKATSFKKWVDR